VSSNALASNRKKNARKLRKEKARKSEGFGCSRIPHLTSGPRNTKLLSFGGEDGEEEEEEPTSFKKKPLVRPDCKCETSPADCHAERAKLNTVVDDSEDSIATTTIPDFVTNISSKSSKGKDKDEIVPSKVPPSFACETRI